MARARQTSATNILLSTITEQSKKDKTAVQQNIYAMEEFDFRSHIVGRLELLEFSPVQAWCYCFILKNGAVIIGLGGMSLSLLCFLAGTLAICNTQTAPEFLKHCDLYLPDKFILPVSSAVAGASLVCICTACNCALVTVVYIEDQRMIQILIVYQLLVIFHISLAITTYLVFPKYILFVLFVTSIMTALNFH